MVGFRGEMILGSWHTLLGLILGQVDREGAMSKRKDSATVVKGEGDKLEVTPLGAGNEVGRSCVYMTYKGKTVMVCYKFLHYTSLLQYLNSCSIARISCIDDDA